MKTAVTCNIRPGFGVFWHGQCCTQPMNTYTQKKLTYMCSGAHIHQLTISPKCAWLCMLRTHPKIAGVGWEVWKVRDYSPFPIRPHTRARARTHTHTHIHTHPQPPLSLVSRPVSVMWLKTKSYFAFSGPHVYTVTHSEVHVVSLTSSVAVSHSQVPA